MTGSSWHFNHFLYFFHRFFGKGEMSDFIVFEATMISLTMTMIR